MNTKYLIDELILDEIKRLKSENHALIQKIDGLDAHIVTLEKREEGVKDKEEQLQNLIFEFTQFLHKAGIELE